MSINDNTLQFDPISVPADSNTIYGGGTLDSPSGIFDPNQFQNLSTWYDATRFDSMVIDSGDNVALLSDLSGQSGAPSGDSYLELDGTSGAYASTPDSAALSSTGDKWLDVDLSVGAPTSAGDKGIVSKFETTSSFLLRMEATTGLLRWFWVTTAGTSINKTSTLAYPFAASLRGQIAVSHDVDNGASGNDVKFWYRADGSETWTQLGDTITTAGTTDIRDQTSEMRFGAQGTDELIGNTYRVRMFDALVDTGTPVLDVDFTTRGASNQTFAESSSNAALVTINGSARITHLDTENCLVLPGVAGNYASSPDSAAISITGNICLLGDLSLNDWTPAVESAVFARRPSGGTAAQSAYQFDIDTAGKLRLVFSDGAANSVITSTTAPTVSDYGRLSIRVDLVPDNGASGKTATFYTGTSISGPWTILGAAVTTAGAITINDPAATALGIGSVNNGLGNFINGKIYHAQIIDGTYDGGTLAFDADFTGVSKLATSFTESSSNAATVTINSTAIALPARIHGARDLYQGTAASQPKYLGYEGSKYGYTNAASGTDFSTPSSAALQQLTNLRITVAASLDDWSAASETLLSKRSASTGEFVFRTASGADAKLELYWYDGISIYLFKSTLALGFSDHEKGYVRATKNASAAGNITVKFYYSSDGAAWTQLGADVTQAALDAIATSNAVRVGSTDGTSGLAAGKIYSVTLEDAYDADGTIVFSYDADAYVSGSTLVDQSSNAATITINGGAVIVDVDQLYFDGTADYLKSAAFSLSQPENMYFLGKRVSFTNGDTFYDGSSFQTALLYQNVSDPLLAIYAGTALGSLSDLGNNANEVLYVGFNGASSSARSNLGTALTGNAGTANAGGFTLGARATGVNYGNITASTILIYDTTAHDTVAQDQIITALAKKGSIDV